LGTGPNWYLGRSQVVLRQGAVVLRWGTRSSFWLAPSGWEVRKVKNKEKSKPSNLDLDYDFDFI